MCKVLRRRSLPVNMQLRRDCMTLPIKNWSMPIMLRLMRRLPTFRLFSKKQKLSKISFRVSSISRKWTASSLISLISRLGLRMEKNLLQCTNGRHCIPIPLNNTTAIWQNWKNGMKMVLILKESMERNSLMISRQPGLR